MIKSQRFWSQHLKSQVKKANEALKTKNFTLLKEILEDLIELLKDQSIVEWKDRVAICFILEQMADVDPVMDDIIDALMDVLKVEEEPHVKEFAVWALGKIVEKSQSLEIINLTMPVLMKFLNDDSEQVRSFAEDLHSRFKVYIKEKEQINEQIELCRKKLLDKIEESLEVVEKRSKIISKEALQLNYKDAHERQEELRLKIQDFHEKNQVLEKEITDLERSLIKEMNAFKGESLALIRHWRTERGKKEDLIRRIECILRIQSKIWKIIEFITSTAPKRKVAIKDIEKLTTESGRPYSEKEVIEILQQLVDEEIIPNFMLEQIKDYQIKADEYSKNDQNQD